MDNVIGTRTTITGGEEGRGEEGIHVLSTMEDAAHKLCLALLNYYCFRLLQFSLIK